MPRRESLQPSEKRGSLWPPRMLHRCRRPDQSPEAKKVTFGPNWCKTNPAFSPVGVRVPLTVWIKFSQQGIRLKRGIWHIFLKKLKKTIFWETKMIGHLFCNEVLQSVCLNDNSRKWSPIVVTTYLNEHFPQDENDSQYGNEHWGRKYLNNIW